MNCPTWPELDLGEWGDTLLAQLGQRRYPIEGTLELTERCNLGCVHCYINQPAGSPAARSRELATAEVAGLLDQMADAGCLFLLLTGGEVLLRPDFVEIYRHARRRGMLIHLFTNGTLMSPRIADVLAYSRPYTIEITLYGATESTYDRVTQVPGSFARCMQAIELLQERGLPLYLKSFLLKTNHHELPAMRALAEKLGVQFRYDGLMWPRQDGSQHNLDLRLSVQELLALEREETEKQEAWDEVVRAGEGLLLRAERVYGCGAAFRSFHVDSSGRMSACLMARRPSYDLRQMRFEEAWEALGAVQQRRRNLDTACRTCTVNALCLQCPGWSQVVHGDDETPVEYVCELGRLRAAQAQRTHL